MSKLCEWLEQERLEHRCDAAWAAGFFDGEGCSSSSRKTRRGKTVTQLFLVVAQSGLEGGVLLKRFCGIVGRGRVRGPFFQTGSTFVNRQEKYSWQVSSVRDALHVMNLMWPFLGIPKREQFVKALRATSQGISKLPVQLELFPEQYSPPNFYVNRIESDDQCPQKGTGEVHNGTDYMACGHCTGSGRATK